APRPRSDWPLSGLLCSGSPGPAEAFGAASFNNSKRFPLKSTDISDRPVALPPGRARLSTSPEASGSGTNTNTHRSGLNRLAGSGQMEVGNVRFGSKADIGACPRHVRFPPKAGID